MKREDIKKILGEDTEPELINELLDRFHSEIETKTAEIENRYSDLETDLENAKTDLKAANATIRKLQKENPDVQELQNQIESYQKKNQELEEQRKAEREERDSEFINSAIENDLIRHQVKDVKSAMVHYDRSKIRIDGSRKITGISDQTEQIVRDKPFLFGKTEPVKKPQQDYSPQEGRTTEPSFGAQLARQHIKEMEERKAAVEQAMKVNF